MRGELRFEKLHFCLWDLWVFVFWFWVSLCCLGHRAFGSWVSSSFHDWIGNIDNDGGWGVIDGGLVRNMKRKRRAWCRALFLRRLLLQLSHCNYLSIPLIALERFSDSCLALVLKSWFICVICFLLLWSFSYMHCWFWFFIIITREKVIPMIADTTKQPKVN